MRKTVKMNRMLLAAVLSAAIPAIANARPTYNGGGGAIPDPPTGANPWGAPGQYLESIINVADNFTVTDVEVSLNQLAQTWQGDLWARLIGPDGTTTINLFQRAGQSSASTFGFSNDFSPNNSYMWSDAGATSTAFSTPSVIPSGVYRAFTNSGANLTTSNTLGVGPATNTLQSFAAIFGGMNSAGNWTLRITDYGTGDAGSLGGWTLNLVPGPGALALLGLAGLVGARRRRA